MSHSDVIIPVGERLPPVGHEVLAVTARFRCLALLDAAGVWHYSSRGQVMQEKVLGWIELASSRPGPLPITPPAAEPDTSCMPFPPTVAPPDSSASL